MLELTAPPAYPCGCDRCQFQAVFTNSSTCKILRLPIERALSQVTVGHELGWIARPSWPHIVRNRLPGHTTARFHDLPHTHPLPVPRLSWSCTPGSSCSKRLEMCVPQIIHMHVVANTSAIRSRIILTKHRDSGTLSQGHLQDIRNQMGLGIVILAQISFRRRAGRIEVPQRRETKAISVRVIPQMPAPLPASKIRRD